MYSTERERERERERKRESQLCLTLCDPIDCSLPGSSFHGIFQARVLEWGAIAFSSMLIKVCVYVCVCVCVLVT